MPGIREKGAHTCHAHIAKSQSSSGATMNPLFLPPLIKAAKGCSLNTTKNRNTILIKPKSPTRKSCSRPMLHRSLLIATPYGTLPKHRKNNGTPSLPGGSCLPSQGKSRRNSTPTKINCDRGGTHNGENNL